LQAIDPAQLQPELDRLCGATWYLHLETTAGAYTQGGFGAFIRNARVAVAQALVRGSGPYRVGLRTDLGWVYAEGVTHWERQAGGLLLAGYDGEGRVTVSCELSATPFPHEVAPQRLPLAPAAPGGGAPPSPERAVLGVFAHPDDETFGCGGTLALYARAGVPVAVACATRGEMGRNMGRPPFATRESLPTVRVDELSRACTVLGVRELWLLGVWDKTSEFLDAQGLADRIGTVLASVRPSLLITQHPTFGGHPDHCAVGAAALAAVARLAPTERPRVRAMVSPRLAEEAGLRLEHVDVGPVLDVKLEATRAHRTQSEAMLQRLAERPEEEAQRRERIRSERFVDLSL
jgi:bacillithiol biosynthesis deacetylase BshB2